MKHGPDLIAWDRALSAASDQAKALRTGPTLGPEPRCLCGSNDTRGRILAQPIDLTEADVTVAANEGTRPCAGCKHGIHHGAMAVTRHYSGTTNVRDHFHPECVEL